MNAPVKVIDPRIVKARANLLKNRRTRFFGALLLYLEIVETRTVETAAVDGKRLFINPAFLDTLTEAQLEGLLLHEILHVANKHHRRRQGRDADLFNQACDYAINLDVLASGHELPQGGLVDQKYFGQGAEVIYRLLEIDRENEKKAQEEEQKKQEQNQQAQSGGEGAGGQPQPGDEGKDEPSKPSEGKPGAGQGDPTDDTDGEDEGSAGGAGDDDSDEGDDATGDAGDDDADDETDGEFGEGEDGDEPATPSAKDYGGCGAVLDAADESPAEAAQNDAEWDQRILAAAMAEKRAGTLPGTASAIIERAKNPGTDWRNILREHIDSRASVDYAWSRPNRRLSGTGFIFPGTVAQNIGKVVLVNDNSGSMDTRLQAQVYAEAQALLSDGLIDELVVIGCDTKVNSVARYVPGDQIDTRSKRGGGTAFAPAFEWIEENEPDAALILYFTDLDCGGRWGTEPQCPTIWASYATSKITPPFGTVIDLLNQ